MNTAVQILSIVKCGLQLVRLTVEVKRAHDAFTGDHELTTVQKVDIVFRCVSAGISLVSSGVGAARHLGIAQIPPSIELSLKGVDCVATLGSRITYGVIHHNSIGDIVFDCLCISLIQVGEVTDILGSNTPKLLKNYESEIQIGSLAADSLVAFMQVGRCVYGCYETPQYFSGFLRRVCCLNACSKENPLLAGNSADEGLTSVLLENQSKEDEKGPGKLGSLESEKRLVGIVTDKLFLDWIRRQNLNPDLYICPLSKKVIMNPAYYTDNSTVAVELRELQKLQQQGKKSVTIRGQEYLISKFDMSVKKKDQQQRFDMHNEFQQEYNLAFVKKSEEALKKYAESGGDISCLKEMPPCLISDPIWKDRVCPITGNVIRFVAKPASRLSTIYYERGALEKWIKDKPGQVPPQWPNDECPLPLNSTSIIIPEDLQRDRDKELKKTLDDIISKKSKQC